MRPKKIPNKSKKIPDKIEKISDWLTYFLYSIIICYVILLSIMIKIGMFTLSFQYYKNTPMLTMILTETPLFKTHYFSYVFTVLRIIAFIILFVQPCLLFKIYEKDIRRFMGLK